MQLQDEITWVVIVTWNLGGMNKLLLLELKINDGLVKYMTM